MIKGTARLIRIFTMTFLVTVPFTTTIVYYVR